MNNMMSLVDNHCRSHEVHAESISLWLKLIMIKVLDEGLDSNKPYIPIAAHMLLLPKS